MTFVDEHPCVALSSLRNLRDAEFAWAEPISDGYVDIHVRNPNGILNNFKSLLSLSKKAKSVWFIGKRPMTYEKNFTIFSCLLPHPTQHGLPDALGLSLPLPKLLKTCSHSAQIKLCISWLFHLFSSTDVLPFLYNSSKPNLKRFKNGAAGTEGSPLSACSMLDVKWDRGGR